VYLPSSAIIRALLIGGEVNENRAIDNNVTPYNATIVITLRNNPALSSLDTSAAAAAAAAAAIG